MTRLIGLFGLAGIFLFISPNLREDLGTGFDSAVKGLDQYSPFSYVGVGLALLLLVMIYLHRSAAPR